MSQQYPFGAANDRYRKKLFVETGSGFVEVAARVVDPYEPPAPQLNTKEIRIVNAPSHIHDLGISSYKCKMTLLFNTKQEYTDYLMYCGWTHKFYDEKGSIFVGSLEGINPSPVWKYNGLTPEQDRNRGYKVEATFIFVKKDQYDRQHRFQFQDVEGHWAQGDIEEMADRGLLLVITADGTPMIYFNPNGYITRAEFVTFMNRTRRFIERALRE